MEINFSNLDILEKSLEGDIKHDKITTGI